MSQSGPGPLWTWPEGLRPLTSLPNGDILWPSRREENMKRRRVSLVLLVWLLCSAHGCSFSQRYPSGWSRPAKQSGIAICTVSGTFCEMGLDAKKRTVNFSDLIAGPERARAAGQPLPIDAIEIVQAENSLTISARGGAAVLWTRQFFEFTDEYQCIKNGVKFLASTKYKGEEDVPGLTTSNQRWYIYLRIAADGSLLVKHKHMSLFAISIIPVFMGSHSRWYKFERKG